MQAPRATSPLTLLLLLALWLLFYASFTLFTPPLLDDADSVHAEVAREMLLRHDPITLYANGIRYLEKAPLLYWSMAASMKLFGPTAPAARLPLALTVLALTLLLYIFARRAFPTSSHAPLYAGLLALSSCGLFLFTRITIPDVMVCLWLTLALYAFWQTEDPSRPQPPRVPHDRDGSTVAIVGSSSSQVPQHPSLPHPSPIEPTSPFELLYPQDRTPLAPCLVFATACALNVLTKGLIGLVFPLGIVLLYLLATRGMRATLQRLAQLHPLASAALFLTLAAPWHLLIAYANPTTGHPGALTFTHGQWQIPLPTDGNVHGWAWFYFVNEQLLRFLNLRVPRDYDTVPLALFWGLLALWLMPWSAFLPAALARALPLRTPAWRARLRTHTLYPHERTLLLLSLWAALPMLFFSLSTRQEYYVLPSLPAFILLIANYLATRSQNSVISTQGRTLPALQPHSSQLYPSRPENDVTSTVGGAFAAAVERAPHLVLGANPSPNRYPSTPQHPPTQANPSPDRYPSTSQRPDLTARLLLALGALTSAACLFLALHSHTPAPNTELATLLHQNPADYALSMGHFLDLNVQAMGAFRLPLLLTAFATFFGPLAHLLLRRRNHPHAGILTLAAATFLFLFAAHLGLQTFAPVLSSEPLATALAPVLHPQDLIVIHGEYESASTLGFYLHRADLHLLEGRSSNLWYGSFFPDAPALFETRESLAAQWTGPRRIFLWQDPHDPKRHPLPLTPTYVLAESGGKQILSNQPNRP